MISKTTLTLVDGVQIIVPDSLNVNTTYVIREQGDWFEDEIKFLRHLLQPEQHVIDIGANYGVYTLSMALRVGPAGRVWSFEPASATAKLLADSLATNEFGQVTLEQKALSNLTGSAQLSLHDNSELNALVRDDVPAGKSETVALVTLDECMDTYDWQDIEFLKLDAEGEEINILRGGTTFFATQSPLVQYEVKTDKEVDLKLVHAFAEHGYSSYRLVPGLNLLAPFNEQEHVDGYLLNLFCCKPDCAARLAARGFLVEATVNTSTEKRYPHGHFRQLGSHKTDDWLTALIKLPYGKLCAEQWMQMMATNKCGEIAAALSCYALSQNATLAATERFSALEESFRRLRILCETQPTYLRLSSFARVAREYGARSLAVNALRQLSDIIFMQRAVNPSEPFLAPGKYFDSVPPGDSPVNWIGSAVLEEFERNVAFSSFYTGASSRQRLELIRDFGFGSAEMKRRLQLIQQRFDTSNA